MRHPEYREGYNRTGRWEASMRIEDFAANQPDYAQMGMGLLIAHLMKKHKLAPNTEVYKRRAKIKSKAIIIRIFEFDTTHEWQNKKLNELLEDFYKHAPKRLHQAIVKLGKGLGV